MQPGFFSQDFLKSLPSDNTEALLALASEFKRLVELDGGLQDFDEEYHKDYLESLAIFRAFCKSRNVELEFPSVDHNWHENMAVINGFIQRNLEDWEKIVKQQTTDSLLIEKENEYTNIFNSEQTYEFSDADLQRIQKLANELRGLISTSNLITAGHKRRLLRRLEAMQSEIHKHTSDIDRFWGFVAEAGIVARKFGEDLKPISDRVTEIGKIVIAVVMSKEGVKALPEISKLLDLK